MNNNNYDYIIEVKDLKKCFKIPKKEKNLSFWKRRLSWIYREWEEKIAVQDINLQIKKGEILGYLGPNGAGKSTTIKILTGILHPSYGDIKVFGNLNPIKNRNEYTQQIGVVFGQRSILSYDIAVKDSFRLFKAIYGLSEEFYQKRLDYLVKTLGIEPFFETPYRMLSLGEKMRCELAASFLHAPKIVFLDEPTIGLDASAKITIRKFLKKINEEEGVTIMITTHDMDDIEEICTRIILIDHGTVAYEGSIDNFKKKYSDYKTVNVYYKSITNKLKFDQLKKMLKIEEEVEKNISIQIPANQSLGSYLKSIVDCLDIIDLTITEPKLENIVAQIYDKKTLSKEFVEKSDENNENLNKEKEKEKEEENEEK